MAGVSFRAAGLFALLVAALYQTFLRDFLTNLGVGRIIQPVTDFPYQCRRIQRPELQACEDMWLDEVNRHLYLACSSTASRQFWLPNMGKLNESARHMKDAIYVLDIDQPIGDSYNLRAIATPSFYGTAGEGSLHTLSITGRRVPGSSKIELYLVNNKPSLNASEPGVIADNTQTGANATIELFEVEPGSASMHHVRTFAHPLIVGPNNVAPVPDGSGFYITNDHGLHKTGLQHALSPYLANGNVVYCSNPPLDSSVAPSCSVVATGLSFPNGLTISPNDPKTLYVPRTMFGKGVTIFKIHPGGRLTKLDNLKVPYPIDNLSPSADGNIYAAAFPKTLVSLKSFEEAATYAADIPVGDRSTPPATVLKISKVRNLVDDGREVTWTWEKVIEDAEGKALPAATVVVNDSKSRRLFMSGVYSYFITVCEPK